MNFYEVLEIDGRASKDEIERAFRKLARQVHPDLNAGDAGKAEARMKLLNEIRDTLTDPLLRAGYDEGLRLEALQRDRDRAARAAAAPRADIRADAPRRTDGPPATAAADSDARAAPADAPRRRHLGPILLVFGGAMVAGVLYLSLRDSRRSPGTPEPGEPEPATAAVGSTSAAADGPAGLAPLPPATVDGFPAPRPRPGVSPHGLGTARTFGGPRGLFHGRGVVRIGSTTDDVMRILGTPDRIEPGRQPGDAVLHYGTLRLEMKNGRVTRGDTAAR